MNQLVWCRTFDSLSSCADTLLFQLSTRACNSSCAAPRCMLWYGVCCSSDVEAFKASSSTSPATSFCRDCAKAEWAVISIAAIDSERGMNARGRVGRLTDADAETALELRATCMNPTFFVPVIMVWSAVAALARTAAEGSFRSTPSRLLGGVRPPD